MRQGVQYDEEYNAEHGGYKITIVGRDATTMTLYITLNWVFAFSEVESAEPKPLLTSYFLRHDFSPCDLERSEISTSRMKVTIQAPEGENDFIFPEEPRKCTSASEEGRWLNVIPRTDDCYPPYCSGDRFSTYISTMSWYVCQV